MEQNNKGFINKIQHKHEDVNGMYNELLKENIRNLSYDDVKLRVLSFLLDAIFMFWPSIIFIISLLLLTSPMNIGGKIIRNTLELTTIYVVSILLFNTMSSLYFRGQTIGMRYYGLKVVTKKNKELKTYQIIARELVGVSVPWVLILLSFTFMGFGMFLAVFLIFIGVNFIIILFDKNHRSLIDLILNTNIVLLPDVKALELKTKAEVKDGSVEEHIKETIKEEIVVNDFKETKVVKEERQPEGENEAIVIEATPIPISTEQEQLETKEENLAKGEKYGEIKEDAIPVEVGKALEEETRTAIEIIPEVLEVADKIGTQPSALDKTKTDKEVKNKNYKKHKKIKKGNSQKGNSNIKVKNIKSISSIKKAGKNT